MNSSNIAVMERTQTEQVEKRPDWLFVSDVSVVRKMTDLVNAPESSNRTQEIIPDEDPAAAKFMEVSSANTFSAQIKVSKELLLDLPSAENYDGTIEAFNSSGPEEIIHTPGRYCLEEKEMIACVVYAESRGECFEGQVAVAQVVINRYESGKFGETIKNIVYGRNQFAVSGRYNRTCMAAVEYAMEYMPYPKNMYFFQVSKNKKWRNFVYYGRIGNHSFYCGKE